MTIRSVSPASPDVLVAEAEAATRDHVAAVLTQARRAHEEWAAASPAVRAGGLAELADAVDGALEELTGLIALEVGKPLGEARGEVQRTVQILRYYSTHVWSSDGEMLPSAGPDGLTYFRRFPRGVAGLITPWNFPLAIPIWKAAPAMAFGNAVVLKPSSDAIGVAQRLGELAGSVLPEGVFNVVPGGAEVAQLMIRGVDVVSMTGSVGAGKAVRSTAADAGIPVQCEMGGQNASIILPDADLDRAANMIAASAMGFAGQKCTATSRIITVGDGPDVLEAVKAAVESLGVGSPEEPDAAVGPVISETALNRVQEAVDHAVRDGGRVVSGGRRVDRDGWFYAPTLLSGVGPDHVVSQEEVFGPLAVVLPTTDLDHAIAVANGVRYGLVSSVFTENLESALRCAAELKTGMVRVNAPSTGVDFYAPFGGSGASSYGPREQGTVARDHYTEIRTITINS